MIGHPAARSTAPGRLIGALALVVMMALALPLAAPANAQVAGDAPLLTIESERFFSESAFGQRVAAEIDAASTELASENRRIEAELMEEEQALTDRRAEMDPDEFRALADEFDTRVQRIRREQEAKARILAERTDTARVTFLSAARPVLGQLMRDAGASVVLERGSVFFSSNASDITDRAISSIDAAIGDGADAETAPPPAGDGTGQP